MTSLATAYAEPQLQAALKACRAQCTGMQTIARMRELLMPVQRPVLATLGLSEDADGLAAMQNAVNRRICEGDVELQQLANEALRLLDLAPMKQLAQTVTAEEWFEQLHGDHAQWDSMDVEEVLAKDGATAKLVADLRRQHEPRGRIGLGMLTVWSHWERLGLREDHGARVPAGPSTVRVVQRLHGPSVDEVWEFVCRNEPVVISGMVDSTCFPPLVNFADFDYLRKRCGRRPVKLKGDLAADREGRHLFMADPTVEMAFGEYLELVEEAESLHRPPAFYMGKMPLHKELPELCEDISQAPDSPWAKLASCFGANSAGIHTYFGCGRNTTATHFDPSENILVVVCGQKTFELYPPTDVEYLYPTKAPGYVHSAVPPFTSPSDMPEDLKERFKLYENAQPMRADLEAGDVLYLPIFWWHSVTGSMERNMIINWWSDMHDTKKATHACRQATTALAAVKKDLASTIATRLAAK